MGKIATSLSNVFTAVGDLRTVDLTAYDELVRMAFVYRSLKPGHYHPTRTSRAQTLYGKITRN